MAVVRGHSSRLQVDLLMSMSSFACRADLGLLASGAVVFGVQKLVPTYDASWYKSFKKPS
jgi:hypothetical protein